MTDDGVFFSDTFDRDGSGTLGGDYTERMPGWWEIGNASTASATCKACGHTVALQPGESIPYGDPRLCEHMGQKP